MPGGAGVGHSPTDAQSVMRQVAGAPQGSHSLLATEGLKVLRREVEQLRMERDILKKAVVGSSGESNTGLQYSRWRPKARCLSRTLIQADRDPVQVCLGVL
jgi:hypothetical protein